jgi:hypothetical protein
MIYEEEILRPGRGESGTGILPVCRARQRGQKQNFLQQFD